MKTLALVLIFASSLLAAEGPYRAKLLKVTDDDPIHDTLSAWKEKTKERYAKSGDSRPEFDSWSEIPSESLKTLFPEYSFFTVHWNEMPTEKGKGEKLVSRAYGLYVTLACNKSEGEWSELFGYGNYEEYGRLLTKEKVTLQSKEKARIVWNGFCDLHQKHWKDQGIERKSESVWHLGVITIDDFHYYYRVEVSEEGEILSAKLHADKIETKGDPQK